MPSKSKSQQRLFGMVRACQKTGRCASPQVEKMANSISQKDAADFARTKHEGLPQRVETKPKGFKEWLELQ